MKCRPGVGRVIKEEDKGENMIDKERGKKNESRIKKGKDSAKG
jgi:hypothetical protein